MLTTNGWGFMFPELVEGHSTSKSPVSDTS